MAEFTQSEIETLVKAAEMGLGGSRMQVYEEIFFDNSAGSGTNTKNFSRVEPGRIRVITHFAALNAVTSNTFIKFCHYSGGQLAIDKVGVAPLVGETVNWDGMFILGEGDYAQALWLSCSSGDDLYAVISGYEIFRR